jgi:hypothetical protein
MPNNAVRSACRRAARHRRSHRVVRAVECTTRSREAGNSMHSSNAIATSTPNPSCSAVATSGVIERTKPSIGDRNVAPPSSTFTCFFNEKT